MLRSTVDFLTRSRFAMGPLCTGPALARVRHSLVGRPFDSIACVLGVSASDSWRDCMSDVAAVQRRSSNGMLASTLGVGAGSSASPVICFADHSLIAAKSQAFHFSANILPLLVF